LSRKTRKELRQATREYKEAKKDIRNARKKYAKADKRDKQLLQPKTEAEKRYLKQKKNARRQVASKEISQLKERKKEAGVKRRQAIQRNGGTTPQKVGRLAHNQATQLVDGAFQDNDYLEDVASARQNIRRAHVEVRQAKKIGKYSIKIASNSVRNAYASGNRTYNLVRGKGFTRTPVKARWETKVKNK